jgi:pimeloyl-ACP methyl ester carboxylesterase
MSEPATAVLVHGIAVGAAATFGQQRELERYVDLVLFERLGYGPRSADAEAGLGWPVDADDLVALMERTDGAHLVGHSYGGVVVAVAAARRPDLVRSLVLVEPSLGHVVSDAHPALAAAVERERPVRARADELDAREFTIAWMGSLGAPRHAAEGWIATWGSEQLALADVARRERWYAEAPVDLEALAAIRGPRVIVMGASRPPTTPDREAAQASVEAMSLALAQRIGGELVRFDRSTHVAPVEEPERFNELLRRVWGVESRQREEG